MLKPAFNSFSPVLLFPLFQDLMIAAFGLDDLTVVGVAIDLGLASAATAGGYRFSLGVRISEHRDRPFRLIVTAHFANA